jgi:hypothetical protein
MRLPYLKQKEIISRFLLGENEKKIAKDYKTTKTAIVNILENRSLRTEVEKSQAELYKARENKKISQIKDKMLDFITDVINEGEDHPNKLQYIDKISNTLTSLDKIVRLNMGENTENSLSISKVETKNTNINATINVNEFVATLDTPEKQDEFLRSQLFPIINKKEYQPVKEADVINNAPKEETKEETLTPNKEENNKEEDNELETAK